MTARPDFPRAHMQMQFPKIFTPKKVVHGNVVRKANPKFFVVVVLSLSIANLGAKKNWESGGKTFRFAINRFGSKFYVA